MAVSSAPTLYTAAMTVPCLCLYMQTLLLLHRVVTGNHQSVMRVGPHALLPVNPTCIALEGGRGNQLWYHS